MDQLKNQQGNKIFKSKPWITKGIKKSISIRGKLYKEISKEKNVLTKVLKHKSFENIEI